jgi:hypothetical protein
MDSVRRRIPNGEHTVKQQVVFNVRDIEDMLYAKLLALGLQPATEKEIFIWRNDGVPCRGCTVAIACVWIDDVQKTK